jgi:hypothetical protein
MKAEGGEKMALTGATGYHDVVKEVLAVEQGGFDNLEAPASTLACVTSRPCPLR